MGKRQTEKQLAAKKAEKGRTSMKTESNHVNENYPINLLNDIAGEDWEYALPEDFNQSLAYVLAGLTEREQGILIARYKDAMTYEAVGKNYGVTRERIRQIEAKAIRKLRHPTRIKFLIYGVSGLIHKAYADKVDRRLENAINHIAEIAEGMKTIGGAEEFAKIAEIERAKRTGEPILIETVVFSVRTFNCLKRAGLDSLQDVANLTAEELTRVRNLGKKGYNEVVEELKKYGLSLKGGASMKETKENV